MGFAKYRDIIKKSKIDDDAWEELIVIEPAKPLGSTVLQNYLKEDGDVIEIDLQGKSRRTMGNFIKALNIAKGNQKIDFLLRYSNDFKKAYIKRVG